MEKNIQQALSIIVESKLCVQQCKEQADTIVNMSNIPFEERHGARLTCLRLNQLIAEIEEFIEENTE